MRLRPTSETELTIARLTVQDYEKQLEELKHNKATMEYAKYRFLYVKLQQGIANNKKKIRRIIRNDKNKKESNE